MSQIIITGKPTFEDVKLLVDMLPESDRRALKNYLSSLGDGEWEKKFEGLLSRFRAHGRSEEEIEKIVVRTIKEVRNAKKAKRKKAKNI
jgi:hypothetical protein